MITTGLSVFQGLFRRTSTLACLATFLVFPTFSSSAEEFSAKHIGDYGNITVMEATGNYDAMSPDGTVNAMPRQLIAKEFFKTHKDEYDFIVVFTNFDFRMPAAEVDGFYTHVRNDVKGIGKEIFDYSDLYGSSGKLQGTIDMGNLGAKASDPLDPAFETTSDVLAHELLHRWGAYVRLKDAAGNVSQALLGRDGEHWNYLLDTKGSLQYGNQWQDNGNGTFTSGLNRKYYSPLDLYLMGMIDKSKVPPMLLIENPSIDPAKMPEAGVTISGTTHTVTIDDIIAVEGARVPSTIDSQKQFKIAFIYMTAPGTFTADALFGIENIRNGFLTRFSILTDGQGLVKVTPSPKDDVPTNPGIRPPTTTPRTLPPTVDDGVRWLIAHQQTDGSWTDFSLTTERDTAEAVTTLQRLSAAQQQYQAGLAWLGANVSTNADFLARRVEAAIQAGGDAAGLVQELMSRRNPDGGWGSGRSFISNPTDTALALQALGRAGYSDQIAISKTVSYLQGTQNQDGGWSGDDTVSTIQPTAAVVSAFNLFRKSFPVDGSLTRAMLFLAGKQNSDGGFGNSPSTIYDSSVAVMALQEAGAEKSIVNAGIDYLLGLQTGNGSWQDSPYQTALAVRAIWQANVDPDLSVKSDAISFIPTEITTLPTNAVVSAVLWNMGRTDVPQVKVAIYDGAVTPEKRVAEQTVASPGMSPVTVTFSVPITDGNSHFFYVVVDPDNAVKESNENNNSAANAIFPVTTYDFEVSTADLTVSPNPVDMYQEVRINARISNKGTMTAYNVPVRLSIEAAGVPFDIATVAVDIPAGGTVTKEIGWKANKAGINLPLTVAVDPLHAFQETSTSNNKAASAITVNPLITADPNLYLSYRDIAVTPNPITERESVTISATIRNDGNVEATNIVVAFYTGAPGADVVLLGTRTIPMLKPNEAGAVSLDWLNIVEAGEKVVYVKVDPGNAVKELTEDDNGAFTKWKVLSFPDLAVSANAIAYTPHAPRDGEPVAIGITVQNNGDVAVASAVVKIYEGEQLLNSQVIPAIAGHSQAMVTFLYETTGKAGVHQITVTVGPPDGVTEHTADNNSAVGTFTVFKSDLMLSEPYFSPNGDGVKDTTRFSFRFDSPWTIKIEIANKKGEVVKTFNGSEFSDAISGSIVWDGLNSNGRVVDDGEYRILLKAADDAVLNDVPVVVDTNRSSLVDAILSGNVVSHDLSCMMPSDAFRSGYFSEFSRNSVWLPNNGGIIYFIQDLEEAAGVYVMSTDGKNIAKLLSGDWLISQRRIGALIPSPDGTKVALVTQTGSDVDYTREIWAIDADGANLFMLDSRAVVTYAGGGKSYIGGSNYFSAINFREVVKWSPDNQAVSYSLLSTGEGPTTQEIISVDVTTNAKSTVFSQQSIGYVPKFEWSPDGEHVVVASLDEQSFNRETGEYINKNTVKLVSKSGSEVKTLRNYLDGYNILDSSYHEKRDIKWISSTKLLLTATKGYEDTMLDVIDVIAGTIFNAPQVVDRFLSPDNKKLAWYTQQDLQVYDVNTNQMKTVLSDPDYLNFATLSSGNKPQFSPDGSRLGLSALSTKSGQYDNIVIDIDKNTTTIISKSGYRSDYSSTTGLEWTQNSTYLFEEIGFIPSDYTAWGVYNNLYLTEVGTTKKYDLGIGKLVSNNVIDNFSLQVPVSQTYLYSARQWLSDGSNGCTLKSFNPLERYNSYLSVWAMTPTTNLTAEVVPVRQKSQVLLTGSASDLYFEGYKIEYALFSEPGTWYPIIPYAETPVSSGTFGAWIPPFQGVYYVKLTVWDKAGNETSNKQRISWGESSSITDLYKSAEAFSPNGDGIKDTVELHYRVLEPVHLEVKIYDVHSNIVRTLLKHYTIPASGSISWDGRDESGHSVPDGTYRIKVSDFEFAVKADTTPPDVGVVLGNITEAKADLTGHAFDENFKRWVVEYGEGENPQQWLEFRKDSRVLAAHDSANKLIDPVNNSSIKLFLPQEVGWLSGKKFRLTAEDQAGNRSSAITGFVDEIMAIYEWDGSLLSNNEISGESAKPGAHSIAAVETIRTPLASMTMQYSDGLQWNDVQEVAVSASGKLDLSWDTFNKNLSGSYGVRIKARDELGREYYSNTITVKETALRTFQSISECKNNVQTLGGVNYKTDFKTLSVQIKSSQDSRYEEWTDFKFWAHELPAGKFILTPPDIKPGMTYFVRMVGTDSSGSEYTGVVSYPAACPVVMSLKIEQPESDCGHAPGPSVISATIEKLNASVQIRSLSYFIEKSDGLQLLRTYDLATSGWGDAIVDTSSMAEGGYPVSAVLTFLNINQVETAQASDILVVDHVGPTAKITYPTPSLQLCPNASQDSTGVWYGVPLEGIVSDNSEVKRYEVYFGLGEDPGNWLPASRRKGNVTEDIAGQAAINGEIGILDVTNVKSPVISIKLKAVDIAGNATCSVTNFSVNTLPEIRSLAANNTFFSPNADGISDSAKISYSIDGAATVETKVYQLTKNAEASFVIASAPVRKLVDYHLQSGGIGTAEWDGKNEAGTVVSDGMYAIAVSAKDGCGNTTQKWVPVEVDNAAPLVGISYPKPEDTLGTVVEIKGTADDLHFKAYTIEAGEGENPAVWHTVADGATPGILARWSTYGLQGKWILRVSALDAVGNKSSVLVPVDLVLRPSLIKNMDATPKVFSPNNDTNADTSLIAYELTEACQVKIEILDPAGMVMKDYTSTASSGGMYKYVWDGKNHADILGTEGRYSVRLTTVLVSNPSITQSETVTVVLDTTAPKLGLTQPSDNAYVNKTELPVNGTVDDQNLLEYAVSASGPEGIFVLDKGTQNRAAYTFGTLNDKPEGAYTLAVEAKDVAGNIAAATRVFTIDRTPPQVSLEAPTSGTYFGSMRNVIDIAGTIVERNLERFSLRLGEGEAPNVWQEVVGGSTTSAAGQAYSWKVGKGDGVADGVYTLSLYAKDKAGQEKDVRAKVVIDNTSPETRITSPKDGEYINRAFDIFGTLLDANLDTSALEVSAGACAEAYKWSPLKTNSVTVQNGLLNTLEMLPSDGDYCLKLTATDKVGNRSDSKINIHVDTRPPAPPVVTGKVEGVGRAVLDWARNSEPDFAGYNVYLGVQKLNQALLSENEFSDANLKEGSYTYTVTAVDLAGNEGGPSNAVNLVVDVTPPTVGIASPKEGARVSGQLAVKGTAFSADDFRQYRVYTGSGNNPATWELIRTSPLPTAYGTLAIWETASLAEGAYAVKVEAEDLSGNSNVQQVSFAIDNTPPRKPQLLSATATGADVDLRWSSGSETDLAGYLVYRNDRLANGSETGLVSLEPLLVSGTSYVDKSLPDGNHAYYVVAMDQAENQSDQSNSLLVNIDLGAPHATIKEPASLTSVDGAVRITAESRDTDIAHIEFQYRRVASGRSDGSGSVWTGLGSPVTTQPYSAYFDPHQLGLAYGKFQIQAVATDSGGKTDFAPDYVEVVYADLVPPAAPVDLKAVAEGKDVILTWTQNAEQDLNAYHIYRVQDGYSHYLNYVPAGTNTFRITNLADGIYTYEITAVDTSNNQGKPSTRTLARIYAPLLLQSASSVATSSVRIQGGNAGPNASVEVIVETALGFSSPIIVVADVDGNFNVENLKLELGENKVMAKATDSLGNTSRISDPAVIVYDEPPVQPTGLVAVVQLHDVGLTWNPNVEQDVAGYNLYRNGERVNKGVSVRQGQISASSYNSPCYFDWREYNWHCWSEPPANAFDGRMDTYWGSDKSSGRFYPQWWEMDLPTSEFINRLEVQWGIQVDSLGQEVLYAGRDFEVQAWSGSVWVPLKRITGNNAKANAFGFSTSYRTNKIRLYITATTDPGALQVRIAEVTINRDNLIGITAYDDTNLSDGKYAYTVTAVDSSGFESGRSDEAHASIGDVIPPTRPEGLSATATGSAVALDWSTLPNLETDLAGYNVFRHSPQGWVKLNATLISGRSFDDTYLLNGTYSYRITAVDQVGNESIPSNAAEATISVMLPPPPSSLSITPVPEGNGVAVIWDASAGAISYDLYRGTMAGGPYNKVNGVPITSLAYPDSGLTNGNAYFYVVTAVDPAGNESTPSSEASGVPTDVSPPDKPSLSFPTAPGMEVLLYQNTTDIVGSAEPGVIIELFRDGTSVGRTSTVEADHVLKKNLDFSGNEVSVSYLGNSVAYSYNSLWLKDVSGTAKEIVPNASNPVWAPDDTHIAYRYYDAESRHRLGLYDINSRSNVPLTNDQYVYEESPTWSEDGSKIGFVSNRGGYMNVWVKDAESGSLTQISNGNYVWSPKMSPDGRKVAYFENQNLRVADIDGSRLVHVDSSIANYYLDWSPDGKQLAFFSRSNGYPNLYVMNIASQTLTKITDSINDKSRVAWSPDGTLIAYAKNDADGTSSLWLTDLARNSRRLQQQIAGISDLKWTKRGELLYATMSSIHVAYIKSHYVFSGVKLDAGDNNFFAVSIDDSGNVSSATDEITVVYDTSFTPDVAVTSSEVFIYPPFPKPNEQVIVNAAVKNPRNVAVENVDVDVYVWDSSGNLNPVRSQTIERIDANSETTVSCSVDAGSELGQSSVIVVVDPANKLGELLEDNNSGTKDFYVTDKEEIFVTTSLDAPQYSSNQEIAVKVTLHNSGMAKDGVLNVWVEDVNGSSVAVLGYSVTAAPSYATLDGGTYTWNTGATFAGSYKVHAAFIGSDGTVSESSTPFELLQDVRIDSGVVTNKKGYGANEKVAVTITLKNNGSNNVVPLLKVKTMLVDSFNATLRTDDKTVPNLFPGIDTSLSSEWNTGLYAPGDYRVMLEVYLDNTLTSSSSTSFSINTVSMVKGSLTFEPATILVGNNIRAAFTLANMGNIESDGVVKAIIVDPESREIVAEAEQTVRLLMEGSQSGEFIFSSQGLKLMPYLVSLQYVTHGNQMSIARGLFTVKDGAPPIVTIISPVAEAVYNSTIPVAALVSDNASGLDKVEYQIDDGPWKLLPVAELVSGKYATNREPTLADNGLHTIRFRATDRAGNVSTPVSVKFVIQMDSTPPVTTIAVGEPKYHHDRLYVSSATVLTLTATDDYSGVAKTEYRINNGQWLPSAPFTLVAEGDSLIDYQSVDNAGNLENEKSLNVILDKTPPTTAITASDPLMEGVVNTVSPNTAFSLAASDNLSGVKAIWYRIDGGAWQRFSEPFTLAGLKAGNHTISFSAADNVENDEAERAIMVQLVLADVKIEIPLEPVVLVGAWMDNLNKVKNRKAIAAFTQILSRLGASFHVAGDGEDFKRSLRSGRYNTYILVDYKDEQVGREIREAVNYGDSLVFIKTLPSADPVLNEVLGVKFTGKTAGDNLTVTLLESPLHTAATMLSSSKSVIGIVAADTATVFGYLNDKGSQHPAVICNKYGNGRTMLLAFDFLSVADQETMAGLLRNAIEFLKPERHTVRALDSVPVRITVAGSTEPLYLQVEGRIPPEATVDTITSQGTATAESITWLTYLAASAKAELGYYLNLPDAEGTYTVAADVMYANGGDYRLYEKVWVPVTAQKESAELLRAVITELNDIPAAGSDDLVVLTDATAKLAQITTNTLDAKEAEKGVEAVTSVTRLIGGLSSDTANLRLMLDELLKILQRKWYLIDDRE